MKKILLLTALLLLGISTNLNANQIKNYQKACDKGDMNACTELGKLYDNGMAYYEIHSTAKRERHKAYKLYKLACDNNYAEGCFHLSYSYVQGGGVRRDAPKGIALITKTCNNGYAKACYNLAHLYAKGFKNYLKKDEFKFIELYTKACNSGHIKACHKLGMVYEDGFDKIKKNNSKAKEFYGRACDKGLDKGCEDYARLDEL